MFQRRPRKFRRRPNGRNRMSHTSSGMHPRLRPDSFSNGQIRNNFRNSLSVEKLFEKYSSLAKEATSSGDKTLAENYLQHADHYMRIIEDKNRNRSQNTLNVVDKPVDKPAEGGKNLPDVSDINQNSEDKNKN